MRPLVACFAVGAILAGVFYGHRAVAHGPAQWIADGHYRDLKPPNTLCCGDTDCAELHDDEVEPAPGGYHIIPLDEFVPMSEVQWAKPGGYWRCHYPDGHRRCFFAPPAGT